MIRFFPAVALVALLASTAGAQPLFPSVFADFDSYESFVIDRISDRDFVDLVIGLGGGDEYTPGQLAAVDADLRRAFRRDFENHALMKAVKMEEGFREEARAFWTGQQYGYFYALLHDRGEDFVVLRFELNTSVSYILGQF